MVHFELELSLTQTLLGSRVRCKFEAFCFMESLCGSMLGKGPILWLQAMSG